MEPMQETTQESTQESTGQDTAIESGSAVDQAEDLGRIQRIEKWVRRHPRKTAIWGGTILLFLVGFIPVLKVPPPHVSLSGEPILAGGWLTNSLLTTIVVDIVIIGLALLATIGMKVVPGRWQSFVEMVLEYLYSLSESVSGRRAKTYFPWVVTIFLFIIVSNWVGLIPGVGSIVVYQEPAVEGHALAFNRQLAMADGKLVLVEPSSEDEEGYGKEVPLFRSPTADLNTTLALALITMIMVQFWGIRSLGLGYFGKFFQFQGPNTGMKFISTFVGLLELLSEFSRIIAFTFRLFGNIFAGEIVLATMAFLIAYLLPVPFYLLEVFVGFVQALVFMMLALVFFTMATMSHEHDH